MIRKKKLFIKSDDCDIITISYKTVTIIYLRRSRVWNKTLRGADSLR